MRNHLFQRSIFFKLHHHHHHAPLCRQLVVSPPRLLFNYPLLVTTPNIFVVHLPFSPLFSSKYSTHLFNFLILSSIIILLISLSTINVIKFVPNIAQLFPYFTIRFIPNFYRERLNDEESEQKFVALALAFSIDAMTIKDRCQRQRRYRDQTEKNLTTEIDRLIDKVYRLQPLCIDAETTEMLTDLLTQVDIVMRAAAYVAISAERFGAVQHEDRLAQAVEVMIKHVTLLKQQRDSARKHLQYTK